MPIRTFRSVRRARATWVLLALALVALVSIAARPAARVPGDGGICSSMSDADLAAAVAAHFRASPAHGNAVGAITVDTFQVSSQKFNADHNLATVVDTVHIAVGQSVMFKWVSGNHTTTSGVGGQRDAGALWDLPVDVNDQEQVVTFPAAGTYPFFCVYHYTNRMIGAIIVTDNATPTRSGTWGRLKANYR